MNVQKCSRGPGIALVDTVAVSVELQRTIKMRALFDRAFAAVLDHAAPEYGLTFFIRGFQFEPGVVGVDGAAGEKVADLLGAHHHVHTYGVISPDDWLRAIQRRGDRRHFDLPR